MANIKYSFCITRKWVKIIFISIIFIFSWMPFEKKNALLAAQQPSAQNIIRNIMIDPGHGGKDAGAQNHIKEKDVVLKLALILEKKLKKEASYLNIFFTRKTDTLIPLVERASLANSKNIDLFLSLHVNANPKPHVQGIETYIVSSEKINTTIDIATRENSSIYLEENPEEQYKAFLQKNPEFYIQQNILQRDFAKKSLELADKIQENLTVITKSPDRSVKQAGFVVLFLTKMPSVLIEIGFLSNKEEEEKLAQDAYIEKIAQGIASGLLNYVQEKNKLFQALDRKKNKETGFYTIQIGRSKNNLVPIPQNFKGLNEIFKMDKNGDFIYCYGKFKLKEDAKEQLKIIKKKYNDSFILQWNE